MNKISSANLTTFSSIEMFKNSDLLEFKDQLIKKTMKLITWANLGMHNQTEVYLKEIL